MYRDLDMYARMYAGNVLWMCVLPARRSEYLHLSRIDLRFVDCV